MSCITKIDYDCPTVIGDSFIGHQYTFDTLDVIGLEVTFTDRYKNKVDDLYYTVDNGRLTKTGSAWQMKTQHDVRVEPGTYDYVVVVSYIGSGGNETIITGKKTFIR